MMFDDDEYEGGFETRSEAMREVCNVLAEDCRDIKYGSEIEIRESELDGERNVIQLITRGNNCTSFSAVWFEAAYYKKGTNK